MSKFKFTINVIKMKDEKLIIFKAFKKKGNNLFYVSRTVYTVEPRLLESG